MKNIFSTREVATDILEINPDALSKAIWQGRVIPPPKGPGGSYYWTVAQIKSAAWVLGYYDRYEHWEKLSQEGGS